MPKSRNHSDTELIAHKPAFPEERQPLKACPACGKCAGELKKGTSRFPYRVQCRNCGWTTNPGRLAGVAIAAWSKAKLRA